MNSFLLILISAFVLAALYLISIVVRRRHARPAPRRGKHALGKPVEAMTAARANAVPKTTGPDDAPTEPALPISRAADSPEPSSELFEQRYAAKFERLHKRADQLRARMQEI